MTNRSPSISPTVRWTAIILSTLSAATCVSLLAPIGTAHATILAIICASLPLAAWWEARRLRGLGYLEAADTLVLAALGALVALAGLAGYTAELAELATSCACPPR
jgi:hypothetical protein